MTQASERQARVQALVLDVLAQQAIDYEQDEHDVYHARIPISDVADVEWVFAFDREAAEERAAGYISYVNPRFQKLLQAIGDGPAFSIHFVRSEEHDSVDLYQSRFAWHVKFSTYGEAREELFEARIGSLPEALTTDAFDPLPRPLPARLKDHYTSAKEILVQHIEARLGHFVGLAEDRLQAEADRLRQFRPYGSMTKADLEAEAFYQSTVERHLQDLSTKYEVDVTARLVSLDVYLPRHTHDAT